MGNEVRDEVKAFKCRSSVAPLSGAKGT